MYVRGVANQLASVVLVIIDQLIDFSVGVCSIGMKERSSQRVAAACMQLPHVGAPAKTYTCAVKTAGRSGCWLRAIRAIERAKAKKGPGCQSSARGQSCLDATPGSNSFGSGSIPQAPPGRQVGLGG